MRATSDSVAVAYSNSAGKPEKTALYDIDTDLGLLQQTTPNDGIRGAVGVTGSTYVFDIASTADLTNAAYLATGGTPLTVALAPGAATKSVDLTGFAAAIGDIAILPAL